MADLQYGSLHKLGVGSWKISENIYVARSLYAEYSSIISS